MKKISLLSIVVLLLPINAFALGGHTGDTEPAKPIIEQRPLTADEQTIQDVLNTYALAMEKRDISIAEQAVIPGDFSTIESGYANWSWDDFKKHHLSVELDFFKDISYKIELLSGEFQGDLGFCVYRFTTSGTVVKSGNKMTTSGLATCIMEKTEQGWRIHHIHSSVPRPMTHGSK